MDHKELNSQDGTMPLLGHLEELRIRLIRCFLVLAICVVGAYFFRKEILEVIRKPIEEPLQKYTVLQPAPIPKKTIKIHRSLRCDCEYIEEGQVESVKEQKVDKKEVQTLTSFQTQVPVPFTKKQMGFNFSATFDIESTNDVNAKEKASFSKIPLNLNCVCDSILPNKSPAISAKSSTSMVFIGLPELFFSQMKVAFFAGLFLAFPYLLIELWGFVGPALYSGEKKMFWIFAMATYFCFIGGALFGYFIVFPFGFDFFLSLTEVGKIMPSLSIGEYLGFTLKLLFAFGIVFEFPLAVFILARLGVITPELMIEKMKYALLIFCILAAVLTPPDPFTMFLMAGPLILLYFISLGIAYVGVNRKKVVLRRQGYEDTDWKTDSE